jgi:hypothetical protein
LAGRSPTSRTTCRPCAWLVARSRPKTVEPDRYPRGDPAPEVPPIHERREIRQGAPLRRLAGTRFYPARLARMSFILR